MKNMHMVIFFLDLRFFLLVYGVGIVFCFKLLSTVNYLFFSFILTRTNINTANVQHDDLKRRGLFEL